jgi:bacteriocin-like protein
MKTEENKKQEELTDEQLDNVAGGGKAGAAGKAGKISKKVIK